MLLLWLVALAAVPHVADSARVAIALLDGDGNSTLASLNASDAIGGSAALLAELDVYRVGVRVELRVVAEAGDAADAALDLVVVRAPSIDAADATLNSSLAALDLAGFRFSADSNASAPLASSSSRSLRLGVGQSVSLSVDYACLQTFSLLDRWLVLSRDSAAPPATTAWSSVEFAWRKQCNKRGCAERCAGHGTCDELAGACMCNEWWFGADCQWFFKQPTTLCPGQEVTVEWMMPGDRSTINDWYSVYPANYTDQIAEAIEWRYLYTKSTLIVTEAPEEEWTLNSSYSWQLAYDQAPGQYTNILFLDGVYDKAGEILFNVSTWAECGASTADACKTSPPCSGHGSCLGDSGVCTCTEQYKSFDCSRGCGTEPQLLTAASGAIRSGPYTNNIVCKYDVQPSAAEFDLIKVYIDALKIEEGDIVRIERVTEETDNSTASAMATPAPAPTQTVGTLVTLPISDGYTLVSEYAWTSKPEGVLEISTTKGVRVVLASDKWNVASGIDFRYEAVRLPRELSAGEIAGIVIGGFAAATLLAALLFGAYVLLKRRAKRNAEAAARAANAPALTWTQADEVAEVPDAERSVNNMATTATGDVTKTFVLERVNEKRGLFADAQRARCPVGAAVSDTITLFNDLKRPQAYAVHVPVDDAVFECTALPGTGVLAAGERRAIAMSFTLKLTTTVWRYVKVTFEGTAGAFYVPIVLEGDSSLRLDPDNVDLLGRPLGDGAYGVVYRGRYRGADVAVKIPKVQHNQHDTSFETEVALFEKLRCPYIVNFIGASHVPDKLCTVTELCPRGSLSALLKSTHLATALKAKMALDAAEVVAYLHQNGVIYRDLKPDNLLVISISVTAAVNVKLGDFGTALTVKDPYAMARHSRGVGTPIYMAPELMMGKQTTYNAQCDVYSLALVIWELLSETPPYSFVKRSWDLPELVINGARPIIDEAWPADLQLAISKGWLINPASRPKAAEMVTLLKQAREVTLADHQANSSGKRKNSAKLTQSSDTPSGSPFVTNVGKNRRMLAFSNDAPRSSSNGVSTSSQNNSPSTTANKQILDSSGSFGFAVDHDPGTSTLSSDQSAAMALAPALDAVRRPSELLNEHSRKRQWKKEALLKRSSELLPLKQPKPLAIGGSRGSAGADADDDALRSAGSADDE